MDEFDEAETAEDRERCYRLLAGLCLRPPSEALIEQVKDGRILALFEDGAGRKSCDEMARFVREASGRENLSAELTAEHTSIFVLPSSHLPHEAVYLDRDKRLGGRVTIGVRQFYERAGADILENCVDMPDHLGMELEFMGFLCGMEKKLRKDRDSAGLCACVRLQKEFIEEHLLKWVYQCCEKIGAGAASGFYKAVAYLTAEFMRIEEDYVVELHATLCSKGETICEVNVD
jgi:TorA maturation chaperone TorD